MHFIVLNAVEFFAANPYYSPYNEFLDSTSQEYKEAADLHGDPDDTRASAYDEVGILAFFGSFSRTVSESRYFSWYLLKNSSVLNFGRNYSQLLLYRTDWD